MAMDQQTALERQQALYRETVNEHWQTINAYVNLQCIIISSVGENLFGEKL